ncbi:TWiK family of potassium channels protein 7 [Nilaparvata lugens]|uniref:TWiK family of potassium channels protein 7 n=1 Tax=Nilaparvata lugens TaxID=108931 RepID=UPI00193E384C|nr:TWiK family of potassium channels protein 7 [Nilaparvata lugens]
MPQEKLSVPPPACMMGVEVKKAGSHQPVAAKNRMCCFCMCGDKAGGAADSSTAGARLRRRKLVNGCLNSVAVCVGLIGYTFLGAVLFVQIEGDGNFALVRTPLPKTPEKPHEWPVDFGDNLRNKAVENIWEITVNLNILYRENWTRLAALEIARFQEQLAHELAKELEDESNANSDQDSAASQWDLASGLLYSITILTTTGYGKLGPKTVMGKTATMLYAAVGIPLMLVYLSSIGQLLSTCVIALFRQGRPKPRPPPPVRLEPFYIRASGTPADGGNDSRHCSDALHKSPSISINSSHYTAAGTPTGGVHAASKGTFSTVLCFGVMIAYICCGAVIVCLLEKNWSYLDGVFFCFMTLSTINFVDGGGASQTPGGSTRPPAPNPGGSGDPTTVWFFSLYILWGMALTAMCFNIFHREVVYRLDYSTSCHPRPIPGGAVS